MAHARPIGSRLASAAAVVAIVVVAGSGCSSSDSAEDVSAFCGSSAGTAPGVGGRPEAIALIGADRLVRLSLTDGRIEADRRLPVGEIRSSDPEATWLGIPGPLLVQPAQAGVVLVLVRRAASAGDEVLGVDPGTLDTRCRYRLTRGVRYRGIAVGDSGRMYAFGYRDGSDAKKRAAVLTTLEPRSRPVTETVRPPRRDWFPRWGAVTGDERHVIISYHGSDTSGADWLETARNGFRRCPSKQCPYEVHGAVEPYGDGFLATDGQGMLEVGWNGRIERLPVRPRSVHLMDFALDAPRGLVYVSSCGESPAIQRLDLADMRVTDVPSGRFCGAPFAVSGDRYLVLAAGRVDQAGIPPAISTELRVLDLRHPGPGTRVSASGVPQDAVALSTVR